MAVSTQEAIIIGSKSLLAQNYAQDSQKFDLNYILIVNRCSQWWWRLFLEAWHSMRDQNSVNEPVQILDMYASKASF